MSLSDIVIPHFIHRMTSKMSKISFRVSQDSKESAEEKLEEKINNQDNKISTILLLLNDYYEKICPKIEKEDKGKSKVKKKEEFYHMKERFKEKLDSDKHYIDFLWKSNERGLTLMSCGTEKCIPLLFKRGYYVRRVKESLWLTFVYDNLYKPINPEDAQADTYISLIIKSVFTVEKEFLEVIFDEKHLLSKIDSDVIENWTEVITDTKMNSDVHDHYSLVYLPSNQLVDNDSNNNMSSVND
ncbi:19070_t:CDS:2 [Funneliformis geosporum]|nr:19070_t:CDS:2 [Funneliformis geosporum]